MIPRKQQQKSSSSQSGFTIIESLVAIIVVAILLTAISPILVIATATRLQARRVELATQAARSYIDGVKSGAIAPPPSVPAGYNLSTYPAHQEAPQDTLNLCGQTAQKGQGKYCQAPLADMYCYGEGDSTCDAAGSSYKDMIIQVFRFNPDPTAANKPEQGYSLGVRVYRADAFKDAGYLKATCDLKTKQATYTGGNGFRKAPLVEMTTEITTSSTTFDDFSNRIKSTGTSTITQCKLN